MIIIEKRNVSGIPLLEIFPEAGRNQAMPTVFFVHGITSAKEHNLHYAYLLAEHNFRVILPEANYHGERSVGLSNTEIAPHFWEIVIQTIHELDVLKTYYVQTGRTIEDKIGLAGTSMGGIITLGALTQHKWIKAAVSLMGNPSYEAFANQLVKQFRESGYSLPFTDEQVEAEIIKLRSYDLSQHSENILNRPLLFWHGKKDPIVPFHFAYDFYQKVKVEYPEQTEHLQFIVEEEADHKVSRAGLLATIQWFNQYLK